MPYLHKLRLRALAWYIERLTDQQTILEYCTLGAQREQMAATNAVATATPPFVFAIIGCLFMTADRTLAQIGGIACLVIGAILFCHFVAGLVIFERHRTEIEEEARHRKRQDPVAQLAAQSARRSLDGP